MSKPSQSDKHKADAPSLRRPPRAFRTGGAPARPDLPNLAAERATASRLLSPDAEAKANPDPARPLKQTAKITPTATAFDPPQGASLHDSPPQTPPQTGQRADGEALEDGAEGLRTLTRTYRGFRWGAIFISSLMGLMTLAAGLWVSSFVQDMFAAQGVLGWIAVALFFALCLAAVVIIGRELLTLSRLKHLEGLRETATSALAHDDAKKALEVCSGLKDLLADRRALAWTVADLREHENDIMSARERLALAERSLLVPLDREARSLIAKTAQRVSIITALSPMGVLDVLYVGAENLKLMRHISGIYGGRPGTFALLRLGRMVLTNLIIAGTMALGEDVIQQLLGQKLGAKISARLGEGILNGALTARVGLATIHTIRPLPFIDAEPARFRDFLSDLAKGWKKKFTGQ